MWFDLPQPKMDKSNSCLVQPYHFPYSLEWYSGAEEEEDGIRTLKVTADEIHDIARRFVIIYPSAIEPFEEETYRGFRCLVNDEASGISRGILERLGYSLEESDYSVYGIYWITLKTREEKRKKK